MPNNVVPFTPAENDLICKLSWQAWDYICYFLAVGTAEELEGYVAEPEELVNHRDEIDVVAQDAVPVYLDMSTGKVLVPSEVLDEVNRRRLQKRLIQEGKVDPLELTGVQSVSESVGSSRREKNRLTFFMRQKLSGLWDQNKERPEGKILDGILLTHGAKHARLEDMSFEEPSVWLRECSYELDGVVVPRKAGDRVGSLGAEWRDARRREAALFYSSREGPEEWWLPGKVRVWFQQKATEDSVIAGMLSDLIVEEGHRFALSTTDCVASEHSPQVQLKNWLNNQPKHTIGMRQTFRTQVTDLRYAKLGKDGAEACKHRRRRLHRLKAKQESATSSLVAKHLDMMHICLAMQQACVEDNEQKDGVVKAFRMGGWLAYRPTSKGLKPAIGSQYSSCPLGSSRLPLTLLNQRYDWINENGVPQKPDWNELKELRIRQACAYIQKKGEKNYRTRPRKNMCVKLGGTSMDLLTSWMASA